jgi:hypothetical protein
MLDIPFLPASSKSSNGLLFPLVVVVVLVVVVLVVVVRIAISQIKAF